MKNLLKTLALTACGIMSVSASAAHYCNSYVDSIRVTTQGVAVFTSSAWDNARQNVMELHYADNRFTDYLQMLSQAQANNTVLKIYILEEFDGDDARSCKDGVTDYIGSIH